MRLAVVIHHERPAAADVAARLKEEAERRGMAVTTEDSDTLEVAGSADVDVVVAVGGDGTVLRAARAALAADVPLFGVNVGRKGFLADVEPAGLEQGLDALASGMWEESRRMTLEARINDGPPVTGINDVVIEKVLSHRLISIAVTVDRERFINYHADGLIMATPTGSTAYSLSAGGPLVAPEVEALILSPVAPHSLFSKSLVLHPDVELACKVVQDRPAGVSVDGYDLGTVAPGDEIQVRRGPGTVRFIELSGTSFAKRVKEKFHLSEDLRLGGVEGAG